MRPGHRLDLLGEEDDDPMLSAVNLVDVFLVLVVALLTAVALQAPAASPVAPAPAPVRDAGSPDMELVVHEHGNPVRFRGSGTAAAAEGSERAGVAYRLKDGSIVYVPEAPAQASP